MKKYFQVIHRIICMGHWLTDEVARTLKPFTISEPQYNVMRTLFDAQGKPLTVHEIQKAMVQQSSNVTRIIDKLVTRNLVKREECAKDRRKMDITLTAEGVTQLKKMDAKIQELHLPRAGKLNHDELLTLEKLIKKLREE